MVRETVLKLKDPKQILEEIFKIDLLGEFLVVFYYVILWYPFYYPCYLINDCLKTKFRILTETFSSLLTSNFVELDSGPMPLPTDKALKEKKKKLKETLDRVTGLYVSCALYLNIFLPTNIQIFIV